MFFLKINIPACIAILIFPIYFKQYKNIIAAEVKLLQITVYLENLFFIKILITNDTKKRLKYKQN